MSTRTLWLVALLLGGTGCVTTAAPHQHAPAPVPQPPRACRPTLQRVVDLTQRIHPDMAIWPGSVPFSKTVIIDHAEGYRAHKLELGEGIGTHVDAPLHFLPEGGGIDGLRPTQLVASAAVIDVSSRAQGQPDFVISPDEIVDWEAIHGPLPPQALVLFHTGWSARFDDPTGYANADAEGVLHFPGIGVEAAELLVERGVVGVGIDTLSIDPGTSTDFAAHKVILASDAYHIENLTRLEQLPPLGATVIVGVLPVQDGTQAPARVLALVPETTDEETP